ncbi:MFS transporter [Acrocarpospora catenulata]|uniref:MFS transporter n=1 Tax=Acrocarpospora catenulata TaxID=2836182 RepID=UPI001BD94325|nr:MFS transporter [Acrocarpospora catenulata]
MAFAVVCVGLAAVAHTFGGGSLSGPSVGAGFAVTFGGALAMAGRERALTTIMPVLGGLQILLHLMFALTHAAAVGPVAKHVHSELTPDAGMAILHVWAVVVTAVWLARGEAALWALLRMVEARLPRLLKAPSDLPVVPVFLGAGERVCPVPVWNAGRPIRRRGPPFWE